MKIASWNVNSLRLRLPQIVAWINEHQPDVLGLQETKVQDEHFPLAALRDLGYQVLFTGQKSYNGMALLVKQVHPISDVQLTMSNFDDESKRFIAANVADIRIVNVYVPNGASVDSDKYQYKLNWLSMLRKTLQQALQTTPNVVVMGDFNIAPEDRDVHDPIAWEGHVLVSPLERAALTQILQIGMQDAFRFFEQADKSFSWWDYRAAGFRRNAGLRIDLILLSDALRARCLACKIDKEPRKNEQPSDHAPVWVEVS